MGFGIEILAALLTSLIGGLAPLLNDAVKQYLTREKNKGAESKIDKFLARVFDITIEEPTSYKQRLEGTLEMLKKALSEADKANAEFTELIREKEKNIDLLENRLSELSNEESSLKRKVETLQKVPIEALAHFEEILNKGDKQSAFRDYMLFVLGAVLSVIVTLILKFYFGI